MNMKSKKLNSMRGHLLDKTVLIVIAIFASAIIVRADGGVVLWQRSTGLITVTAFTTQSPLRTGPADISFLIENNEQSRPILDAQVFFALEDESGVTMRGEATHDRARNKLLYCSPVNLIKTGRWKMSIIVMHGSEKTNLVNDVEVIKAQSQLVNKWKLLVFPFAIICLFIVHQRLAWKEKPLAHGMN